MAFNLINICCGLGLDNLHLVYGILFRFLNNLTFGHVVLSLNIFRISDRLMVDIGMILQFNCHRVVQLAFLLHLLVLLLLNLIWSFDNLVTINLDHVLVHRYVLVDWLLHRLFVNFLSWKLKLILFTIQHAFVHEIFLLEWR